MFKLFLSQMAEYSFTMFVFHSIRGSNVKIVTDNFCAGCCLKIFKNFFLHRTSSWKKIKISFLICHFDICILIFNFYIIYRLPVSVLPAFSTSFFFSSASPLIFSSQAWHMVASDGLPQMVQTCFFSFFSSIIFYAPFLAIAYF